jgi:Spy/CpxP family protein refolding chaperone
MFRGDTPEGFTIMMRRWIRRSLIGLAGAGLLLGSLGGLAACGHRHHHGAAPMSEADLQRLRERVIDKASRELQLDEAQRARLGLLADALQAQRRALSAGGAQPRAELQALLAGERFDRARAQALVDGKATAVKEGAPSVISAFGDFFDGLRPEQQEKLRGYLARGRGHHGWWRA